MKIYLKREDVGKTKTYIKPHTKYIDHQTILKDDGKLFTKMISRTAEKTEKSIEVFFGKYPEPLKNGVRMTDEEIRKFHNVLDDMFIKIPVVISGVANDECDVSFDEEGMFIDV